MSDAFVERPAERPDPSEGRLPVLAAILLGIAATLTAWSAYQAALLDGEALQGYTESNAALSDANFFYNQGNQTQAGDQGLFVQYATATQEEQVDLAEYLKGLMRPEMQEAVDWWIATPEATTPFDEADDNPYVVPEFAQADALATEASDAFDAGKKADDQGDQFELASVLLALTLFFGGIATLFRRRPVALGLLGVAAVTLVAGVVQVAAAV